MSSNQWQSYSTVPMYDFCGEFKMAVNGEGVKQAVKYCLGKFQ